MKLLFCFINLIIQYDFRQSICELDEKMFMTARLVALELRNHYVNISLKIFINIYEYVI